MVTATCAGRAFNALETRPEIPSGSSSGHFVPGSPCVISRNGIPSCWNLVHPDRCRCLFLARQPDANDYGCCPRLRRRFQRSGSASSPTVALMPKRPTKQQSHSWAIYHIKGTPAKFIGITDNAPDADGHRPRERGISGPLERCRRRRPPERPFG